MNERRKKKYGNRKLDILSFLSGEGGQDPKVPLKDLFNLMT